ncbi:metallophosphoesterase [Prauserella marina]|uniref:Predicted phosphohydrolase, MPP superfamily n=1 Tax=Prauserella marina TaxID=530584 RepID=A0A222VX00_9PSEU|nr:metallophosphoesterase [Prauserella marina]ASR38420.1 metallophosphoesterase [Prauserella marina]PWV78344.1 putative MPP superfamily phosphohydrolase [Prauserella marina]SDC83895.1 Predicted phosphohydrolase, MPP superfamily [Prauserella marina]
MKRLVTGTAALGAATLGYAVAIERRHWTLRTAELPVLADGSRPIKVLHISDLHMLPGQESKQRWVAELDQLEPDLVVNTGDNLAHRRAVPGVIRALGPLLSRPGVFVFGSNDYYAPKPKNPARYLMPRGRKKRVHGRHLPWRDLRAAFIEHGWLDLTHVRRTLTAAGQEVFVAGVDDPHLHRDRYADIAGRPSHSAALRLGITHSPEPRVLDPFASDGYDLVLAGHTHGGQLRVPGVGALVTNCELDRSRARGVSRWGADMWLHVSAGLGTSPYAPARFACPPEASLLTLVPRDADQRNIKKAARRKAPSDVR